MPGVCAVVSSRPEPSPEGVLQSMVERLTHYSWHRPSRWSNGESAALGGVAIDPLASDALFVDAEAGAAAFLDGEIYEALRERDRLLASGVRFSGASPSELLLRGIRAEGHALLARLQGVFSAVVWDQHAGTLTVVTDPFGMRPTYVAQPRGAFVVASETAAVRLAPGVDTAWDEDGISQFFAFGHFFGDSTFYAGVRALPAGVCGVYRLADGTYHEERYVRPYRPATSAAGRESVLALERALVSAVERRAHPGERLGLSLSGGLDARTILALMPPGLDLKTVSLGIEGSLDHRSSSALAALAGVPHRNYVLDAAFLSEFERHLREMVRLTDGHYLDQGIVMPTMPVYRELGVDFLHRGHGGELLHMKKAYAFSLDSAALGASEGDLEDWLFSHLTGYMLAQVPDDLLVADVRPRARAALRAALDRTGTVDRPVDRVWQLFVNERLHRETALSMHMFGSFATVRMPFIDREVIEALSAMPAEMKLDETLQAAVLRSRRPEFLDVTNANTGAPVGCSAFLRELGYLRLRIGAKLGFKGYQPYERLGLWLRRELRPMVEALGTHEPLLDSGLFEPQAVRRVVEQHLDQQANHTFILMALMILGIGISQRS